MSQVDEESVNHLQKLDFDIVQTNRLKIYRLLTCAVVSIALETIMAGAIEGTFGVLTRSIVVASMGVSSTFIGIRTVEPIPFVTWFTRAVIRANLVVT